MQQLQARLAERLTALGQPVVPSLQAALQGARAEAGAVAEEEARRALLEGGLQQRLAEHGRTAQGAAAGSHSHDGGRVEEAEQAGRMESAQPLPLQQEWSSASSSRSLPRQEGAGEPRAVSLLMG